MCCLVFHFGILKLIFSQVLITTTMFAWWHDITTDAAIVSRFGGIMFDDKLLDCCHETWQPFKLACACENLIDKLNAF